MASTSFLSSEQLSGYGRYGPGLLDREVLDRFFFLDDADREVVAKRRGDHNRLGYALQLLTVRYLGAFLSDVTVVPIEIVDHVAAQLGVADPSCLKLYVWRDKTRLEHQWDIAGLFGFTDFAAAEAGLIGWLEAEAWTTGAGPRSLFTGAADWLRARRVLLPGVTTLADLVVTVRQQQLDRLHEHLAGLVSVGQAEALGLLLVVPDDGRRSVLGGVVASVPQRARAWSQLWIGSPRSLRSGSDSSISAGYGP